MNFFKENFEWEFEENRILGQQMGPGIFKLTCLKNDKVYFGEAQTLRLDAGSFYYELSQGECENSELLADYQKFGDENFYLECFLIDRSLADKNKRLKVLEEIKKSWPGELYNP